MNQERKNNPDNLIKVIRMLLNIVIFLLVSIVLLILVIINFDSINKIFNSPPKQKTSVQQIVPADISKEKTAAFWKAPDISEISDAKKSEVTAYGKDLIAHTSKYLGPKGSVLKISNGMNCQNCHLDAGTKVWGNNYGSVASLYPKFRARSGSIENIYKRVNDCIERSLNGKSLDTLGKEMSAIKTYIEFLGSNVEKGKKAEGSGFKDLAFLDRAADPQKGKVVYKEKCERCHQAEGAGKKLADDIEYEFPPLWGSQSYNDGAGLFRISSFAKYVKYNMPFDAVKEKDKLTDDEAWDVAAFVNSQNRPHKNVPKDWPDKSKKPIDHPFGPYADNFSERQHKYGPFKPILAEQTKREESAKSKKN